MKLPERHRERGTTLIEILVALLLFSLIATATARTLASAQRARAASALWMQAAELGGNLLERLRVDPDQPESQTVLGFTRAWQRSDAGLAGVDRIDVTVRWTLDGEQALHLATLLRSQP